MFKCGFTFCVTESLKKTDNWDAMHIEKQTFITWLLTMAIIKICSSIKDSKCVWSVSSGHLTNHPGKGLMLCYLSF